MTYRLVVFDMDGTLADTSPGIINSHRYAHKMMGRSEPRAEELVGVIGGPLLQTYQTRFGFEGPDAKKAVEFFRSYYAEQGIYEATLYPGISETLHMLCQMGVHLGVATLKAERFVKIMLQHMNILDCFSAVYGMDENDERTKAQLVQMCMDSVGVSAGETVLIGDSIHDLNGAQSCGVSFLGVTYGFGFSADTQEEHIAMCHTPREITRALEQTYQC